MRKILFFMILFCVQGYFAQDVLKPKAVKKESCQKMKEQLVHELEDLLFLATSSIAQITVLIDQVVVGVKELAGEQDGVLCSPDRKTVEMYQERVVELQELLRELKQECCLKV